MTLAAEGVTDAVGTGHGPVSGAGAGRPAAVGQRDPLPCQWQSRGTAGAKSRRRFFREEQGRLWPRPRFPLLQRRMFSNCLRGSPVESSSSWQQNPWQPFQKTWGQQSWSQRGSGSSSKWKQSWGQQREKGWNKWPKKNEGRDWAKQDPKDKPPEGGEVSAAAPNAPEQDPYQVAEATQEEIDAAAARQAEREEEGFHAQLWQDATQQALADPDRPQGAGQEWPLDGLVEHVMEGCPCANRRGTGGRVPWPPPRVLCGPPRRTREAA